ncbi:MAG: TSUP family transporter [Gammaproteobacteria bacterium]|nr:TSUP family transporter [Gammaproteobacteria bacterium]
MLTARIVLYGVLVLVNVAAVVAWISRARRRRSRERATWVDVVIGAVTNFLDTFGIGSYAQITALFKLRGNPADELIPGTLNVGSTVPSFLGSLLFFGAIRVEPVLLASMVISSGAGAWIGAGVVSRLPRRRIQLFMGLALIIAAGFFLMTALGVLPPTGAAMGLAGWRFAVAVGANFGLGALMCIGIGNYAPSMVLLGLLGMHPIAAYPIMIGSDGVLIPVASLGFLRAGRFAHGVALGLTVGGILGTLVAFPLIRTIGEHLALMRWLVIVVILCAAAAMLRSALVEAQPVAAIP